MKTLERGVPEHPPKRMSRTYQRIPQYFQGSLFRVDTYDKGRYHAYMELRDIVPDPDDLLSLEVEELAGILLMQLNIGSGELNHFNVFIYLHNSPVYGARVPARDEKVNKVLMEAWD